MCDTHGHACVRHRNWNRAAACGPFGAALAVRRSAPYERSGTHSFFSRLTAIVAALSRAAGRGAQSPCRATCRRGRSRLARSAGTHCAGRSRDHAGPVSHCAAVVDRRWAVADRVAPGSSADRVADRPTTRARPRNWCCGSRWYWMSPPRAARRRVGMALVAGVRKAAGRLVVPPRAPAREPGIQLSVHDSLGSRPTSQHS